MDIIRKLPTGKHNIAVKLSGGCDSSIIYYALCREFALDNNVNIYVITLNTDKKPFYIPYAQKVINFVGEMTGKYPVEHITRSIPHSSEDYVTVQDEIAKEVEKKYNIVNLYTGITMNPPYEEMVQFFKDNYKKYNLNLDRILKSISTRDVSRDTKEYISNDFTIYPFGQSNKKAVAKLYNYYNILDELYPITRSCEAFTDKEEHCGHCYFCAERIWGFERLI